MGDLQRAVNIRRQLLEKKLGRGSVLKDLPREGMDWKQVHGVCCENVIGFVQIPVGIVGPLLLDGQLVHIPLATTEGALVASTHRGAKAISESGGVTTSVHADGTFVTHMRAKGEKTICYTTSLTTLLSISKVT